MAAQPPSRTREPRPPSRIPCNEMTVCTSFIPTSLRAGSRSLLESSKYAICVVRPRLLFALARRRIVDPSMLVLRIWLGDRKTRDGLSHIRAQDMGARESHPRRLPRLTRCIASRRSRKRRTPQLSSHPWSCYPKLSVSRSPSLITLLLRYADVPNVKTRLIPPLLQGASYCDAHCMPGPPGPPMPPMRMPGPSSSSSACAFRDDCNRAELGRLLQL